MPIYAYRCETCGFAKDVLQKMSDAPLTECPSCAKSTFKKQLTAAGFQLKGTGWYVTDFRNGSGGKTAPAANTASDAAVPGAAVPGAAAPGVATPATEKTGTAADAGSTSTASATTASTPSAT